MKRGALILVLAALLAGTAWTDAPPQARYTWADLAHDLADLRSNIKEAEAMIQGKWQPDCRGYSPEKTIRCAAHAFGVSEEQAVSCWHDESNFGIEPNGPMGHSYHGPFQYLPSTYQSQQTSMPDVVRWFELSPAVHDVRSNILTAIAWASRHGWGPWTAPGCA